MLRDTPADYFQPAVVISGGLAALGVAPWLALLLWKPVAVIAAFYGVRSLRRSLEAVWARRAALVLGLFFGSFTIIYGSFGVLGDLFPAFLSWGYTFGLLALAVMLFALFAYERARARAVTGAVRGIAWAPALLGALASSLHPWQGELLMVLVGSELTLWRERSAGATETGAAGTHRDRDRDPAALLPGPGACRSVLGLARVASKHAFSILTILLAVAPLLLPALVAYRRRPRSFLPVVTRVWPIVAVVIYLLSATDVSATPLHAFGDHGPALDPRDRGRPATRSGACPQRRLAVRRCLWRRSPPTV